MDFTRYAIIIELPTDGSVSPSAAGTFPVYQYWHCQGLPSDPTDFGFAILYASRKLAEKAIKTGKSDVARYGRIVPVTCSVAI